MAASAFLPPSSSSTLLRPTIASTLPPLNLPAFLRCPSNPTRTNSLTARLRTTGATPPSNRHHHPLSVAQKSVQSETKQDEEKEVQEIMEKDSDENISQEEVHEFAAPTVQVLLNNYKEAISINDTSQITTIESQLIALQEERQELDRQVAILNEQVSTGKERLLRLNADFDNFRKRSERERSTITTRVRGDVIESLLPMVDNFERAKTQIKAETEAEQKIDSSYQGIYKQFVEIMKGLGVSVVETVGKEFDPNLHEAIMREESSEYPEGIVSQEFRRGFMLDGKLLRPAMVKMSAGPGPAEPDVATSESPAESFEATEPEADPVS